MYGILILTFPCLYELLNFVQLIYLEYSQQMSRLIGEVAVQKEAQLHMAISGRRH